MTAVAKRTILDACKAPSYISRLIFTPERKYITHILTQLFKLRITFSGFQGMLLGTVKSCKKVKPFFVVLQRLCRNLLLLHSLPVLIKWKHRFLVFFFTLFGNVLRSFLDRTLNLFWVPQMFRFVECGSPLSKTWNIGRTINLEAYRFG